MIKPKPFVQLTLVRVKHPEKFADPRNPFRGKPELEDMESVRTDLRADAVFSVTPAAANALPLVASLVGVRTIGEFWVAENREEVLQILAEALGRE